MDFNPGYSLKPCIELLRSSFPDIGSVVALLQLQMPVEGFPSYF